MVTVQFAAEAGLSSRLIEWFGHGRYSHVDLITPEGGWLGARLAGGA